MDIDGTLIKGTSCERLFLPYLSQHDLFGPRQLASFALFTAKWFWRDREDIFKVNKAYLAGLPVDRVEQVAHDFTKQVLSGYIDQTVAVRLKSHIAAGDRVVLLTGAPDFFARALASVVGAADVIASVCVVRDGRFTSDRPLVHPFGPDKLSLAKTYCQKHHSDIQYAVAYADHFGDRFLLDGAGRAVAVEPDRKLREIARQRNWEIIEHQRGKT
jgi:phosphoserine phosphatase